MPPSDLTDALTDVVTRLEAVGVDYMLTGSAAGCLYGVMRTPVDLDFVVDLRHEQVASLLEAFAEDYYLEPEAAHHAVERKCAFSAIPFFLGLKLDFTVLGEEAFDLYAFSRRQCTQRLGGALWVIKGSDLVLTTLRWARESFPGQQLADIRTIMATGRVEEDDEFRRWIDQLGLGAVVDASRTTRYDA